MRNSRLAQALPLAGLLVTTACGSPIFGDNCRSDLIVARFEGVFELAGTRVEVGRDDPLAPTNVSPPTFRQLNAVLLEGRAPVEGVVWSHGGIGTAGDFFVLAVATPLEPGETRSVAGTFQGGGWGDIYIAPGTATLALRVGDRWATEVQGEMTVLQAAPLTLEVDLAFTLSDGVTGTLSGTDAFRYERGTCRDARR